MRKLIVQQWVTVDNIAAEEDGGLSFVSGEPFSEDDHLAFKASVMGFIDSVDTMILGANTYAQSVGYWPHAEEQGEYGEKLNNLTKFVASSKLDDAPWGDFAAATVTRDAAATIRELKEQGGKDIWLWGSLKLMHSLLDAGVVDEVRMLVCPASRCTGTRVFEDRHDLKVLEATSFGTASYSCATRSRNRRSVGTFSALDRDCAGRHGRRSVTVRSGRMPRPRRRRGARAGPARHAASAGRRGGGRAARP